MDSGFFKQWVSFVVTYLIPIAAQLGDAGYSWVRFPQGSNFSGSANGVSDHILSLTAGCPRD